MGLLESVAGGKVRQPRRILLYGTRGIGKSTWPVQAPSPIYIPTEEGLADIDCEAFFKRRDPPRCTSFKEYMDCLAELYSADHAYQTVVTDSLDWLEELIHADVCRARGVQQITDIKWQEGYRFAQVQWREVLAGLDALRTHRGMTVVLLAHSQIDKCRNPETETYDRYSPKLHKLASDIIQEWADEVLFATYKVYTAKQDEGFNRTRAIGVGAGERVIRTTEKPAHLAKNRLNLPDELPLDWTAYAEHVSA